MSELEYCSQCESRHTKEFGEEFHNRLVTPQSMIVGTLLDKPLEYPASIEWRGTPYALAPQPFVQIGDVVSFEGVYKARPWWKFWRWFSKKQPKQFVVTKCGSGPEDEVCDSGPLAGHTVSCLVWYCPMGGVELSGEPCNCCSCGFNDDRAQ